MQQVAVHTLAILLHFISMSGEERLVGSCRIESPPPFHLLSLSSSLSLFFYLSSLFAFFSTPLWNHSHLNSYSACNETQLTHAHTYVHTHTHTHTVNTARHSAELSYHTSVYSYCFHLLRRWLSNELENTKQSNEEVLGYKQLPTVSIRSGTLHTHTQMQG